MTSNYFPIKSGVPQGPWTLLIPGIPVTNDATVATFANDTAIISTNEDPQTVSKNLQYYLNLLQLWLDKWKIRVNQPKSARITFTNRDTICPRVMPNNMFLPINNQARPKTNMESTHHSKKKPYKLRQTNWLIGCKSQLSTENKLLLYKSIMKPI